MRIFSRLAAVAVVAFSLSGCAGITWLQSQFGGGSAPQANTVAAAEGFYTVATNELAAAINQGTLSVSTVQTVQKDENSVYAALVKVRTAAEQNDSAALAALLAAYNAAFGTLTADSQSGGVTLDVSTVPNPKVTP